MEDSADQHNDAFDIVSIVHKIQMQNPIEKNPNTSNQLNCNYEHFSIYQLAQ